MLPAMNKDFLKLLIAIIVSELAGIIGSVFITPSISSGWYGGLVKPALNPPSWVFGPVWTALFALMGISLFLVRKQHSNILENVGMLKWRRRAMVLFFVQLTLNILWSIIFFGLHSPGWAFMELVLLWTAILATIIVFTKISRPAAWLLVPYVLWVTFAGYLNFSIWLLN